MKATKPRTLESFSKADLITYMRQRVFFIENKHLEWIELSRLIDENLAKIEAVNADMRALSLPEDIKTYMHMDAKWQRLEKEYERLSKEADRLLGRGGK